MICDRVNAGTHKGWLSRNTLSYPERFFDSVLDSSGFSGQYHVNHPVKKRDLGIECHSSYFLDFYFPTLKLDLEIDGKQHGYPKSVEADRRRDEALTRSGFRIHRIKWVSVNSDAGKAVMRERIAELLSILNSGDKEKGPVETAHAGSNPATLTNEAFPAVSLG